MKLLFPFPLLRCAAASAYVFSLSVAGADAGSATWNLNPTSSHWDTAANWTPAAVPALPADTASFGISNMKTIKITGFEGYDINGLIFNPGASAYTFTIPGGLTASGTGVVNNSGVTQNVIASVDDGGNFGTINFTNSATSGEAVNYTADGGRRSDELGGQITFYDNSRAGSGVITANGGLKGGATGSYIYFLDSSTAVGSTLVCNGGGLFGYNGVLGFYGQTTATNVTIISNGTAVTGAGGDIRFYGDSLTDSTVTVNGATALGGAYGSFGYSATSPMTNVIVTAKSGPGTETTFGGGAAYMNGPSAQGCTFIGNGADTLNGSGGFVLFNNTFHTGDSVLIANGGTNGGFGGAIYLVDASLVGGRVELFGNGYLSTGLHDAPGASIGSLEGDGTVDLGGLNLTLGSNSLSTTFSGSLQGDAGSSLTKIGTGVLTYNGASTFPGATTVSAGTLGGKGALAGALTIGTGSGAGAVLAPAAGGPTPATLTTQSLLTFHADGSYSCTLSTKKRQSDQVSAVGITVDTGAQFKLQTLAKRRLTAGLRFVVLNNTAGTPISGTFTNLADGATLKSGNNKFQASYSGGDGNDLTLTVE